MENMTKEQAIEAMKEGNKVTHTFFLDHEWAKMEGNEIITEDGIAVPVELFWENRSRQGWSNGWSIFKYPTTASGSAENTTKERQFNLPPAAVFNLQQIALADDDMVKAPGAAEKYRFIARHILELFEASGSVATPKELNEDQKLVHEIHEAHDLAGDAIDKLFDRLSSLKELVREREEALKELLPIAEDRLFSVPVTSLDEVEAIIERARNLLSK